MESSLDPALVRSWLSDPWWTGKRVLALCAWLGGLSHAQAAARAKVPPKRLGEWVREPTWIAAVEAYGTWAIQEAQGQLLSLVPDAVKCLGSLMRTHPDAYVRLQATQQLLSLSSLRERTWQAAAPELGLLGRLIELGSRNPDDLPALPAEAITVEAITVEAITVEAVDVTPLDTSPG